jgi:cysteine desulfurase family protein
MATSKTKPSLYFDSASTSRQKPSSVIKAVETFARKTGVSHGRGSYSSAAEANRLLFETRQSLARLLGVSRSERLVFTKNATEAINLALKGYLKRGDHVVVSGLEHNAVMRPLHRLKAERAVDWTVVPASVTGRVNPFDFEAAITSRTRLVCMTHASNVCGTLLPAEEVGAICAKKKVAFLLDASQTAGSVPLDVKKLNADFLCFPGHKGLLGPTGTGGLAVSTRFDLDPLLEGGTGSLSDLEEQPDLWPDKFESGTLNLWGLAGLKASVDYLLKKSVESIQKTEGALVDRFLRGIEGIEGMKTVGLPIGSKERVALVSLLLDGMDPMETAFLLDERWGIQVRAGLHCAPAAHRSLGTHPAGTVRFSFGCFNTSSEVDRALKALGELAKER